MIFGERLGALAVDNAMAGYTEFMVSQWLTEFRAGSSAPGGTGTQEGSHEWNLLEIGLIQDWPAELN